MGDPVIALRYGWTRPDGDVTPPQTQFWRNFINGGDSSRFNNGVFSEMSWEFPEASGLIQKVGYTREELAQIEDAFMYDRSIMYDENGRGNGCVPKRTPEEIFPALLRTIDVLALIHGVELDAKESVKQTFGQAVTA